MIQLSLYSCGKWGGKSHYECNCCAYDSFDEAAMQSHVRFAHEVQKRAIESAGRERTSKFRGRVMISSIFWQNDSTARDTLTAMYIEAMRLCHIGMHAELCVAVGEPSDEFVMRLKSLAESCKNYGIKLNSQQYASNVGSSVLRNYVIDASRTFDYVLFTDGDIEIVPYSGMAMIDLLESNKRLGCIGAYSNSYSEKWSECTTEVPYIPPHLIRTEPLIAWTQYGMFRREVFDKCRFEVNGPFSGPGWGFEDDDMAMQMRACGWEIANFRGMRYLHRNRSSSLQSLQGVGHDPKAMFEARKSFFLAKWQGVLHNVAGMQYPAESLG